MSDRVEYANRLNKIAFKLLAMKNTDKNLSYLPHKGSVKVFFL